MNEETPEEFAELAALSSEPPARSGQVIMVRCDDSSHGRVMPVVGELIREEHDDDSFSWFFFGQGWTAEYRRALQDYRLQTRTFGALSHARFRGAAFDPTINGFQNRFQGHEFYDNGLTLYVDADGNASRSPEWQRGKNSGGVPQLGERTTPIPTGVHKTFEMKCPQCRAPLRVREDRIRPQLERAWLANIRRLSIARLRSWTRANVT